MTAYSRIPNSFPSLDVRETQTRRLVKSSLIRKIAMAQNFLWAHGRVYAAHGYEGNGATVFNLDDAFDGESRYMPDGVLAMAVCTFLVPQNWNKENRLVFNYETVLSANTTGTIYVLLEGKNGGLVTWTSESVATGTVTGSFTLDVPVTGEYQVQVRIAPTFSGAASSSVTPGAYNMTLNHISCRFDTDSSNGWSDFPDDFFSDDYPVASVFLKKLIENTLHLWSTRTPEICQASLGPNYYSDSTFTQVARYVSMVSHHVDEISGQLVVYCTHGGAGNEIRLKMDGVVIQTFAALSVGLQTLAFTPFAVTGNAERVFTIEAKSTAAFLNWGTMLLGVQLWESGTDITTAVADYVPLDFNGLEGDDVITAQGLNSFTQVTGLRHLFNNVKWLAKNRLKVLVGDWLHRTYKRGPRFAAPNDDVFDPRVDWTRGLHEVKYQPVHSKNITVMYQSGDETTDAIASFALDGGGVTIPGEVDAQSGYSISPFVFPYSLTFNGHGARLAAFNIFQILSGVETARLVVTARTRRVAPALIVNDTTGSGPLSANDVYANKAYLAVDVDGTPSIMNYPRVAAKTFDDKNAFWLPGIEVDHSTAPYDLNISGRLEPQPEGGLDDDNIGFKRPEGTLYEIELSALYMADGVLTETDLQELF